MHRLADVVVDPAPFGNGAHDGGEVVVRQDHIRRAFGDVRSALAHGAADVRAFERGRVVDAVAGHGDDLALRLQCAHDAHLVFGRDACEHTAALHLPRKFRVIRPVELRTGQHGIVLPADPDVDGHGFCGHGMVARNHDGRDARLPALRDGVRRLRTRRIGKTDETEKRQILLPDRPVLRGTVRHRQYAQRLFGESAVLLLQRFSPFGLQRYAAVLRADAPAKRQQQIRRALRDLQKAVLRLVQRRHPFARAVERQLRNARERFAQRLEIGDVRRRPHERRLRRVARCGTVVPSARRRGIAAQRRVSQYVARVRAVVRRQDFCHRHAVLCERARFVRADHRRRAERFDRRQPRQDRAAFCHTLHAQREHDRDDRGQSLRDRGDRQRDRQKKTVERRDVVPDAQQKDHRANRQRAEPQHTPDFFELLLQGRLRRLLFVEHTGDAADLRVHTRFADDRRSVAGQHHRGGKQHVSPVCARTVFAAHRIRVLFTGHRLAGQRAFLRRDADRRQKPRVRRDASARRQQQNVARHDFRRVDPHFPPVTQYGRVGRGQFLQRVERFLRARLLHRADHGVEHDDAENDGAVREAVLAAQTRRDERHSRRREQDEDHEIGELG